MSKAFNSGSDNGVGVFPYLAVKAGVANRRLRLLVKLCFIAAVKELGRNGNGFSRIAIGEGVLDYVCFGFHWSKPCSMAAQASATVRGMGLRPMA